MMSRKYNSKYDESLYKYSSEYYCRDCNVYVNGLASWQQHIAGRRHAFNFDREKRVEPCQDSFRKRKSAEKEPYRRENYSMNKKKKLGEEPSHEKKNYVGLDYVLVIHKQGKSVFQCFLCDTCTVYHNSKQLTDHVLGDKHQKAYVEQHDKGLIKIKRLKSRKPRKGLLEEFIEQKLFNPNKTETNAMPKFETSTVGRYRNSLPSCDKKRSFSSSKKNHSSTSGAKNVPPHNFLKKTIEQMKLHNRRYELKMTSTTTFVPERLFSSTTPQSISSTVEGDSTPPIYAPSPKSLASENGTIVLSDDDHNYGPVPSSSHSTKATVRDISELAVALTPIEVFNLVLLKLKNVELAKDDIPFLNKVADETTVLSKKFKEECSNSMLPMEKDINVEENQKSFLYETEKDNAIRTEEILIDEESVVKNYELAKEDIPFLNIVADETVLSKKFKEECSNSMLHMEKDINVEENQKSFLYETEKDNAIRTEEILIDEESVVETSVENSASPANVGQNPKIILSDSVWNNLPSFRELDIIRSSFPDPI